jgi:hypothetical protein
MSELTTFRDHARKMAEAEHKPECPYGWADGSGLPDCPCPGCIPDADRALWARLADEVDAYLSHDEEGALFG